MDRKGRIYEGTKENPVKPEDKARLDGYLRARAEVDHEKMMEEKLAEIACYGSEAVEYQ